MQDSPEPDHSCWPPWRSGLGGAAVQGGELSRALSLTPRACPRQETIDQPPSNMLEGSSVRPRGRGSRVLLTLLEPRRPR